MGTFLDGRGMGPHGDKTDMGPGGVVLDDYIGTSGGRTFILPRTSQNLFFRRSADSNFWSARVAGLRDNNDSICQGYCAGARFAGTGTGLAGAWARGALLQMRLRSDRQRVGYLPGMRNQNRSARVPVRTQSMTVQSKHSWSSTRVHVADLCYAGIGAEPCPGDG